MAEHQHNHSNSPRLSPSMSNVQQKGSQFCQEAINYPSPTYGDSPSLAHYSYPPPNQSGPESYRGSPTDSSGSLSLPSMRSLDPLQQQQQQQMTTNLPTPVAQMAGGPYYQPSPQGLPQYPNVTSDPTGQNVRFALPANESRQVSGGRHKKEIKRRTKTGCLTCRKRRIKCDEQHPACRNCQKSKRECLGYDPIFKQQPGPAAIQPAPSTAPSISGIAVSSNPYGNQPHILGGGYGVTSMTFDTPLSGGSPVSGQGFDYTSAIDPALEGVGPSVTSTGIYTTTIPAKRTIEELLSMGGPTPPRASADFANSHTSLDEIKHLFYSIYIPGLENFLETKWFSGKGLAKLLESKHLLDQFSALIQQFAKTNQNDPKEIQYTSSVEARVVWALAGMVRSTAAEIGGMKEIKTVPATDDPVEASNRLDIFEILLTGRVAAQNSLTAPVPGSTDHHRLRELEFWYTMGNFVTLPYENAAAAKDVDETLAALRNLLDGRENRDVLYSIAVARGLGQRVSVYTDTDTPLHLDESDNKSKLLVAKKFVSDEAAGAGTTNVIRRLCDLASRSWSAPTSK
ncbi:Bgt-5132 [Blumeria graminis f. sp. tritici]|uniref:Bgt-5132 n=2 Tax=Blumeria graminis f. sp. tritici TaxID=62690 RepID=A0A061HSH1_BLUGR|nr:hypothetical protein BGT96224_5132 [Blumeria graminis f. sp. tritici 96224]VDB94989.1 Bgt-5132 [Blumeria graminis f. sp. tritici]